MERARIISTEFSTADADCPEMQLTDNILTLSFKDWRKQEVIIIFDDVAAFKWQAIETFMEGEEYDRCHEIENSSWLSEHLKQQAITEQEHHKHYKFNFNACGQLEVLATKYVVNI